MKDIFTELYKKVIGVFQKQEEKENNKEVACNRLKLVLMQDRTNLTPYLLERMRGEMIDVLSKYVEMDKEALELNFEAEGESMALMLSIPVLRAKEEDEIQAILEAEEEAKKKAELEAQESAEVGDETSQMCEACTCDPCECEPCQCKQCECDPCQCSPCECAAGEEQVEGEAEIQAEIEEFQEDLLEEVEAENLEEEPEAVEVCDWENPECNDVVTPKKKKKK